MTLSSARLVVRYGSAFQREYPLAEQTTIGRQASNDIAFSDPEISRQHVRIVYQAGLYRIEDLGSTNGTYVNGRRITEPTSLHHGDVIDVGESVSFAFHHPAEAPAQTFVEPISDQIETPTVPRPGRKEAPPASPQWMTQYPQKEHAAPASPLPQTESSQRRLVFGCGCLLLLAAVSCAAGIFLLDAYAPNILYCGPLQVLFEIAGLSLACP